MYEWEGLNISKLFREDVRMCSQAAAMGLSGGPGLRDER